MSVPYKLPADGNPEGGAHGTWFDDFEWLGRPDDVNVWMLQVNHGETLDH